jgi:ABC-type transport system substrate-binding protein
MKFHNRAPVNGRAVTGEDVVKSQLYVKDEPAAQDSSFQNGSMQSVEAPDAQSVVFKLKTPNAYVFSATQLTYPQSTGIFPKENLDKLDTAHPVGSGPYELTDYSITVRYHFKKFDGFRESAKGVPYLDERDVRIIVDPAAQEAAFRSEQLHIWRVPVPTLSDALRKELGGKITLDEFLSTAPVALSINTFRPPFNDVRVREAIYRILDRPKYLDLLEGGRGQVAPGPIPAGLSEYQLDPKQTEKYFRQDARAAKQLLDAAGYPYGKEIDMSTLTTPRNNQGMEIFQQQVSQAGIKVRLTPMPFAEWLQQKVFTGDWETWYAQFPAYDSPHWPMRLQHTTTNTPHRYNGLKDPAVDAMIQKAEVTTDRNEHVKLIKEIQFALLEKYTPFILTHNFTAYIARWKYVRDYEVNPTAQPMYRTEMWLDKS